LARLDNVLAIAIEHKPGGLWDVLKKLEDNHLQIEYVYAFTSRSVEYGALVILKITDQEEFAEKIKDSGVIVLEENTIGSLM
jgi:hypothetical protein